MPTEGVDVECLSFAAPAGDPDIARPIAPIRHACGVALALAASACCTVARAQRDRILLPHGRGATAKEFVLVATCCDRFDRERN